MCVLKDAVPAEPALQSRDHRDELTVTLPPWAVVTSERRAHVERVAALLSTWATAMHASAGERARWLKAAWLHDALRDAPAADELAHAPSRPSVPDMTARPIKDCSTRCVTTRSGLRSGTTSARCSIWRTISSLGEHSTRSSGAHSRPACPRSATRS